MIRIILIALLASLLTACAATGPAYSDHERSRPAVASDAARVILYRTGAQAQYSARAARIQVDGRPAGSVDFKGFATVDVQPGVRLIQTDMWDSPGLCTARIDAVAGQTYYFEVAPRTGSLVSGLLFGVIGQAIESSGAACGGAFAITQTSAESAKAALAGLALSN